MYNKLARHSFTVTQRHRVFLPPPKTSSPVSSPAAIDARGDLPTSTKLSSHPARDKQKFIAGPTSPSHNATLAAALEGPLRAALVSFAAGTLLLLVVALVFAGGLPSFSRLSDAPWWAWTGGAFGALYVTVAVIVAPRLGVVFLLAATLAGQAVASAAIDQMTEAMRPARLLTPKARE